MVAVQMIASPINPSDLIPVTGAYRSRTSLPFIPGYEGVGVIEAAHPDVSQEIVGKRVIPIGSAGAWQRVKTTELKWCIFVPDDITDLQAATAYINPLTALRMVEKHADEPGMKTAVVNAAGSAIARTLAYLLRDRGIRTIGVRRHPGGEEDMHLWDEVVCTSDSSWTAQVKGADLAFDCVGGEETTQLAQSLSRSGRLVHYGLLSGQPLSLQIYKDRPELMVDLFRLRDWVHSAPIEDIHRACGQVFDLIRRGVVSTPVQKELPLEEFQEGVRLSLTQPSLGKVLLRP